MWSENTDWRSYIVTQYIILSLMVGTFLDSLKRLSKVPLFTSTSFDSSGYKKGSDKQYCKKSKGKIDDKEASQQFSSIRKTIQKKSSCPCKLFCLIGLSINQIPEQQASLKTTSSMDKPKSMADDAKATMEERLKMKKQKKKQQKKGLLPSACVAVRTEKAHGNDQLAIVKVQSYCEVWNSCSKG